MKYRYKRPSFDFYDAVAMECWLSDMAKEGLIYEGNNLAFFRFLKSEPQELCYRVEPTLGEAEKPGEEMLAAYADAGWAFVARQGKLFFIWKATRADATELHTDPIVQSESYRALCKQLTHEALGTGACVAAIFAMILGGFLVSDRPVTLFLATPTMLLLAVAELFVVAQTVSSARSALRVKQMLAEGFALNHTQNYRKRSRGYRVVSALSLLASLMILVISILTLTTDWRKNTADVAQPLPFLPLDEIEQSEEFSWAEPFPIYQSDASKPDIDYNNYVDFSWTPLVPEHYEIRQEGAPQAQKWPDGSGYYTPSAYTEYYRLTFSAFAPALLDEMMERHLLKGGAYTITEPDAFDCTVLAVEEQYCTSHLFAQWGNQVIYIRYQGNVDLSERLDLLGRVLSSR